MYEKRLSLAGIATIVISFIAIIYSVLPVEGDASMFSFLAVILGALVYTPMFFINHNKKRHAYKVPCYVTSAIVTSLLMIGGFLAGATKTFGEPSIYSGIFLLVCYLVAIMFFKPVTMQKIIVFLMVASMIGGSLAEHFVDKAF